MKDKRGKRSRRIPFAGHQRQVPQVRAERARHLQIAETAIAEPDGIRAVIVNEAESPLGWLARRKGKDGKALLEPRHLLAGERLRRDFTTANMMPRMGADWSSPIGSTGRDGERGGTSAT